LRAGFLTTGFVAASSIGVFTANLRLESYKKMCVLLVTNYRGQHIILKLTYFIVFDEFLWKDKNIYVLGLGQI
jgi:hypothetical protein